MGSSVLATREATSSLSSLIITNMKFTISCAVLIFPCLLCDYTDYYENDVNAHNRIALGTIDTSAIYEGVVKPDNIAIHVAQNTVNYFASTLAWGLITHFYQGSGREFSRVKREDNVEDINDTNGSSDPHQYQPRNLPGFFTVWAR